MKTAASGGLLCGLPDAAACATLKIASEEPLLRREISFVLRNLSPKATDASTVISVNSAEAKLTPALGLMVVTFDNESGADEAQLIKVDVK